MAKSFATNATSEVKHLITALLHLNCCDSRTGNMSSSLEEL